MRHPYDAEVRAGVGPGRYFCCDSPYICCVCRRVFSPTGAIKAEISIVEIDGSAFFTGNSAGGSGGM